MSLNTSINTCTRPPSKTKTFARFLQPHMDCFSCNCTRLSGYLLPNQEQLLLCVLYMLKSSVWGFDKVFCEGNDSRYYPPYGLLYSRLWLMCVASLLSSDNVRHTSRIAQALHIAKWMCTIVNCQSAQDTYHESILFAGIPRSPPWVSYFLKPWESLSFLHTRCISRIQTECISSWADSSEFNFIWNQFRKERSLCFFSISPRCWLNTVLHLLLSQC